MSILNIMAGKKTYVVGLVMIVLGLLGLLGVIDTMGTMDSAPLMSNPLDLVLEGLGLGALRKGVASR